MSELIIEGLNKEKKNSINPSRIFRMLESFCPAELLEEIEGDLLQKFEADIKKSGQRKAKLKMLGNAIRFFRPGILLRNKFVLELNQYNMLQNNFKMAIRSIAKRKAYSTINVSGLAIGITCCILIGLLVMDEFSFDKDFKNGSDIYKIILDRKYPDRNSITHLIPHSFANTVIKDYPEIERATTICGPFNDMMISYKGDQVSPVKF